MTDIDTLSCSLIEDYHLLSYQELDSTNEEAKRLAASGAAHGAFIWAKQQNAGRGRMGRKWISSEGNLFLTILLSPEKPLKNLSELSFVTSLAALEMLQPIVGTEHQLSLKWPNDVLLDGKKLAGVLLESFEQAGKQWVAVGVGVNIDSSPQDAEIRYPATCLVQAGVQIISAKIVLSRFIHHFIGRYDLWMQEGFDEVRAAWQEHAHALEKTISVTHYGEAEAETVGTFLGIDAEGRLLLSPERGGEVLALSAGDVRFPLETS